MVISMGESRKIWLHFIVFFKPFYLPHGRYCPLGIDLCSIEGIRTGFSAAGDVRVQGFQL